MLRGEWLAAVPFVYALSAYVATAPPGIVAEGDCSEYVAAARVAGIPHAPGYPTYMLVASTLGRIVPVEHLARALNLASAFAGAATVALVMLFVVRLARRALPPSREWAIQGGGVVAALVLATATEFWNQSLSAEVYTLGTLLFVLCLERLSAGRLGAAALLAALALGVHYEVGVPCALAVALVALARRRSLGARGLARIGGAYALGLVPFLYLPLRSLADPALDFGDPETPARLWRLLTLADMPTGKALARPLGVLGGQIGAVAGLARAQWPAWVLALAALGVVLAFARRALRVPAAIGTGLVALVYAGILAVSNFELVNEQVYELRFLFLPAYVVLAAFAGLAFALAGGWLERRGRIAIAAALVLVLLPLGAWSRDRFAKLDKSDDRLMHEYGTALLAAADGPAVLFTYGDNAWMPLTYLQVVEGARPDVTVIAAGLLRHPWYREQLRARHPELVLREDAHGVNGIAFTNAGRVKLYHADPKEQGLQGFQEVPSGLLRRIVPDGVAAEPVVPPAPELSSAYAVLDMRERSIRADVPNAYLRTAQWWRAAGALDAAEDALEQGRSVRPPEPPMAEFQLVQAALLLARGDLRASVGRSDEARADWRAALVEAPDSPSAELARARLGAKSAERP